MSLLPPPRCTTVRPCRVGLRTPNTALIWRSPLSLCPYGDAMPWLWALTFAILALAVVALIVYQRATALSGRIMVGIAAMVLGVLGLVMVAALVMPS
jgi:hypothetical protein